MTNARSMSFTAFCRLRPFLPWPIPGRPPRPGLEGKVVKFVKVEGVEIACFLGGRLLPWRKTLVLIHGACTSSFSWHHQLKELAPKLNVVAFDLPGHGLSEPMEHPSVEQYAEVVKGAMDQLGLGRVFLAGHSLGGAVAQAFALHDPKRLKGLILISTTAKLNPPVHAGYLTRFLSAIRFRFHHPRMAAKRPILLGSLQNLLPTTHHEDQDPIIEEIRCCPPSVFLSDFAVGTGFDFRKEVEGLSLPTLILSGLEDRLTPPRDAQHLHKVIQGSRLELLEGAGHMLPLEATEWVNEKILDFVKGHSGRRAWTGSAKSLARRIRGLLQR